MAQSKTAQRSTPKPKATGFVPSPNCPRFIPLVNGDVLFRDPATGRTERVKGPDVSSLVESYDGATLLGQQLRREQASGFAPIPDDEDNADSDAEAA